MTSPLLETLDSLRAYLATVPKARNLLEPLSHAGQHVANLIPDLRIPSFALNEDWSSLASAETEPLVNQIASYLGSPHWMQPDYDESTSGKNLNRFSAFCVLTPQNESFAAGYFVLGRGVTYNDHRHGPSEVYLPLAGRARYWIDGRGWVTAGPGEAVPIDPWVWHALRTEDEPTLLFWAWHGKRTGRPEIRSICGGS